MSDTILRVGDVVEFNGKPHVVWFVNDCRAAIVPKNKLHLLQWREKEGELQFRPATSLESENITPNSEGEILQRMGRKGLVAAIESARTDNGGKPKDKNMTDEETKTEEVTAPEEQTAKPTKKPTVATPKKPKAAKAPAKAPKKQAEKKPTKTPAKEPKKASKPAKEKKTTSSRGKFGDIQGFSVVSVIRQMGKRGWDTKRVRAAMDKLKIPVKDSTIRAQLQYARSGIGEVATMPIKELEAMG